MGPSLPFCSHDLKACEIFGQNFQAMFRNTRVYEFQELSQPVTHTSVTLLMVNNPELINELVLISVKFVIIKLWMNIEYIKRKDKVLLTREDPKGSIAKCI